MRQATMKLDRRVKRLMLRDRKYGEALEVGRQWVAITRGLDVLQVLLYSVHVLHVSICITVIRIRNT